MGGKATVTIIWEYTLVIVYAYVLAYLNLVVIRTVLFFVVVVSFMYPFLKMFILQ